MANVLTDAVASSSVSTDRTASCGLGSAEAIRPCGPVIHTKRWPTVPIAPGAAGAGALGLLAWLAATRLEGDGAGAQIPRALTILAGSSAGDGGTDANTNPFGRFGRTT